MQNRDPLDVFEAKAVESGVLESGDLREVDGDVARLLDEAVQEAEAAPMPEPSDVLTDVYVND